LHRDTRADGTRLGKHFSSIVSAECRLKKVYAETLPCGKDSLDRLKKIMIVQEEPDFTIRAKTGWALRVTPQQGWYVGYVEKGSDVWFFATNLEIVKREDAAFRREISMEALRSKGII